MNTNAEHIEILLERLYGDNPVPHSAKEKLFLACNGQNIRTFPQFLDQLEHSPHTPLGLLNRLHTGEVHEDCGATRGAYDPEHLWPDGVIPYCFTKPQTFWSTLRPSDLARIPYDKAIAAIEEWRKKTPVSFRYYDVDAADLPDDHVEIQFTDTKGFGRSASEETGKKGGKQILYIAGSDDQSVSVHELGHVIGLHHEHQRSDRPSSLKPTEKNGDTVKIKNTTKGWLCCKVDLEDKIQTVGAYDWKSVMHYPGAAFKAGYQGPRPKVEVGAKGRRQNLFAEEQVVSMFPDISAGDIDTVRAMYGGTKIVVQ